MTQVKYVVFIMLLAAASCKKDKEVNLRYFEVGVKYVPADWRDSSFIVATSNAALLDQVTLQLQLPVAQRGMVNGRLVKGNGGYNKNATHSFKWRFDENDWTIANLGVEIYDGRPYSDVDLHPAYWFDTVKRFAPWSSYIKREVTK
jgi:hypothetical protein